MVTHTAVIPVSERAGIEQKRSPLLLILRLTFVLSSSALVFDTTPPSAEPAHTAPTHRAIYLNHGWLHRVMGVSPPAGSLSAALIA